LQHNHKSFTSSAQPSIEPCTTLQTAPHLQTAEISVKTPTVENQVSTVEYELKKIEPSDIGSKNLKTAKDLVRKYLMSAPPSEVAESILLMAEKFDFKTSHKSILNKFYKEEKERYEDKDEETKGKTIPLLEDRLKVYPKNVIKIANYILDNEDPFLYVCDTWNKYHMGDRNLGEILACSVASSQILNIDVGIHEKPSGDPESGKSHACVEMGKLCPLWKFRSTTFSPKVLYYMEDLLPGTIIYTDDIDLDAPGVIATIKKVTGDFQSPTIADTIIDGKAVNMNIPPRVNFWLSSVDSITDKQLGTRFVYSNTEIGKEHDHEVNHKQRGKCLGKPLKNENEDILICRCMFEYICDQLYYVFSPYGFVSTWSEESEKRNQEKFLSILFAITVFNYRKRETINGNLIGTLEDWKRAVSIYSHVAQNNSCLLSDEEITILYSLHEMQEKEIYPEGVPHKRLLAYMKDSGKFSKSDSTLKRMLIGDPASGKQGFKEKVSGFSYESVFLPKLNSLGLEIKGAGSTKTLCYTYDGNLFDGIELKEGENIIEIIKNGTFVNCDYVTASALYELFKEDPRKAHDLKKNTEKIENWKQGLRIQKDPSEIARIHQNSKPLISEKESQPITNNNNIIYNNKLRNQKSRINGVYILDSSQNEEICTKILY
jgi:hypothetical protein